MLDHLEALVALDRAGTMTRAATSLRVTQSAVSKRIAALEARVGRRLIEPDGRRVRLTVDGRRLVDTAAPLLGALRSALEREAAEPSGRIVLGVSESILGSWGPPALARVRAAVPGLELVVNAHRSPAAIDHVRSGEYLLALVAGESDAAPDLVVEPLLEEPMVIVPSAGRPASLGGVVEVLSIESASATWRSLRRRTAHLARETGIELRVTSTVQSFAAVVQLARAGFGPGLAPIGIARALGLGEADLIRLPEPGLGRPVSLVARRASFSLPLVASFRSALAQTTGDGTESTADAAGIDSLQ